MANFWTYVLNYWETVEDRWVHAAIDAFDKHWILFPPMWHLPWLSQERNQGKPKCVLRLSWGRQMSLYLANDTRYRHSYYERRIRTRMLSIKWCYFQWPWTNPNPVFKITPLFDAKYLTNGYRYGHSYCRRRIGNRTQAFEWHQFQWPWVISKQDSKVTILFNVK